MIKKWLGWYNFSRNWIHKGHLILDKYASKQ